MNDATERMREFVDHVPVTMKIIRDACLMLEGDLRILGAKVPEQKPGRTWPERFNELNDARIEAIKECVRAALADSDEEEGAA